VLYLRSQPYHLHAGTYKNPASSCQQIAELNSSSLPGYFWVTSGSDSPAFVYCTPNTHCCTNASVQGWMRVANLDMTDPSQGCPTGFRLTTTPKRGCFRTTTPGCTSVTFDTQTITYSKVCGRVIGYKDRSLDGFYPYYNNRSVTLDSTYVDGVSITHGHSPRQHIWTFVAAYGYNPDGNSCPCTTTGTPFTGVIPPFINNEYFCEVGSTTERMWDGGDCPSTSTCCTFNNPPWFCKQLSQTTTDEIEVRVCTDQGSGDEDLQIEVIELYVQWLQDLLNLLCNSTSYILQSEHFSS